MKPKRYGQTGPRAAQQGNRPAEERRYRVQVRATFVRLTRRAAPQASMSATAVGAE